MTNDTFLMEDPVVGRSFWESDLTWIVIGCFFLALLFFLGVLKARMADREAVSSDIVSVDDWARYFASSVRTLEPGIVKQLTDSGASEERVRWELIALKMAALSYSIITVFSDAMEVSYRFGEILTRDLSEGTAAPDMTARFLLERVREYAEIELLSPSEPKRSSFKITERVCDYLDLNKRDVSNCFIISMLYMNSRLYDTRALLEIREHWSKGR